MKRILFVAMTESVHVARWISQLQDQPWDIRSVYLRRCGRLGANLCLLGWTATEPGSWWHCALFCSSCQPRDLISSARDAPNLCPTRGHSQSALQEVSIEQRREPPSQTAVPAVGAGGHLSLAYRGNGGRDIAGRAVFLGGGLNLLLKTVT